MIRGWREIRKISQANLAQLAGISARHLSFIETGRARPGRASLLRIGRALQLSYRQQNRLFRAAGHAAYFPEPALEAPAMVPIWEVISQLLNQHEPFPALVVGPTYDIIWSNHGFQKLVAAFAGKTALERYPNVYRLTFAEDGMRPYFEGWEQFSAQILFRLKQVVDLQRHGGLQALFDELFRPGEGQPELTAPEIRSGAAIQPFTLRNENAAFNFISTFTSFNTATSVTVQEMRVMSLFPADEETRERYLAQFASSRN